jgi:hypothetical protein
MAIVQEDSSYQSLRQSLANREYMAAHDKLRQKYFLPVRELSYYTNCIESAGFQIEDVHCQPIKAKVADWYSFLEVYHEGVLGWVGGAQKVTKNAAPPELITMRKELMWKGMERIFEGRDFFDAVWTYITAQK